MKHPKIMLACLLAVATSGAWAQASFPQSLNKQTANGNITTQSTTYNAGSMPYSGQTDYNGMGGVPEYRAEPSNPSYIGVLGEKWETDKRGRRSTFIHNGQEISIGYDLQKNESGHKTPIILPGLPLSVSDSLLGKKSNLP